MKRIHQHKRDMRGRLIASLAGLIACAGLAAAMAAPASAAVSHAPVITATPDDPNTTHATVRFEYEKHPDEGSTTANLRFYCRQYDTNDPPAAGSGWAACGRENDTPPLSRQYSQVPNGSRTFEVAIRESTNINTQGPIASFVWDQQITSVPAGAPEFTLVPDELITTSSTPSRFEFTAGDDDLDLVDRYECRRETGTVLSCNSGFYEVTLPNGEYSFEVRAGNETGFGPWTEPFEWTVEIPSPNPRVNLEDVSVTRWTDATSSELSFFGYTTTSAGDVNGDGRDDLIMHSGNRTNASLHVVFGSAQGKGSRSLTEIDATEGYRIIRPPNYAWDALYVHGYVNVGDQNGDGVPDLAFIEQGRPGLPFNPLESRVTVVYGVKDPSTLPLCPDSSVTRCVDLTDIDDDQGYMLMGLGNARSMNAAGDFDGDGIVDIALGSHGGGSGVAGGVIVKGGVSSGTTQVSSLPADQVLHLIPPPSAPAQFGTESIHPVGDVNGDGLEDVFFSTQDSGGGYIFYGRSFTASPFDMAGFTSADGIRVFAPALTTMNMRNVGDINGDGRADLAVGFVSQLAPSPTEMTIVYGPEQPAEDPIVIDSSMSPEEGYVVNSGYENAELGTIALEAGDLNNDGVPDLIASAPGTVVDGVSRTAAYVLFGQRPSSDNLGVGGDLTPDLGVAIIGGGSTVTPLGDQDGDGLPDFEVSGNIVPGSTLINQVKTGQGAGVANESAVVTAGLSTNNRDSEVWFEYGTGTDYGSSTDPQSFEASPTGDGAVAGINGLEKNTTYHYRAVAKNELGLVRYGDDRTFTTTNADDPIVDPCEVNPGAAGCPKYCEVNPTALGCPDYDWCANNPGRCDQGGPGKARIAMVSTTNRIAVRRGQRGVIPVAVVNTGGQAVRGVRVCVRAPKRLVRTPRCVRVGALRSGASKIVRVRVAVKRNARRGQRARVNLTANGQGVAPKRSRAVVVIR